MRKKDEDFGGDGNQNNQEFALSECSEQDQTDWHGCDSVDGDHDEQNFVAHTQIQEADITSQQNGHKETVGMDLEPMLALYSEGDDSKSRTSPLEKEADLTDGPQSSATDGEVIIQGRRPIFSETEESVIATQLKQWKEQGMKYTRLDVVKMASEYAVQLGKRPKGRPLTVKWFRSFLTRHPECYIRKSRKLNQEKPEKPMLNHLDSILSASKIKNSPHCIFSLLEISLPVVKNGELMIPQASGTNGMGVNGAKSHGESLFQGKIPSSILFCGSAAGQAIPPFFIFAGKTMDKSWITGVTPGTGGVACSSGHLDSEVLISFLKEHFFCQAPGRTDEPIVLLVDATVGRFLNQSIVDLASSFKVIFVTAVTSLNPHLHPMAVGCCNNFQREFCFELQKPFYSDELASISSASVCEFLCRLYHRNMSAENLHATFKKAGIFPFNPNICRKRYASSVICLNSGGGKSGCSPAQKMKKEAKMKRVSLEEEGKKFMDGIEEDLK